MSQNQNIYDFSATSGGNLSEVFGEGKSDLQKSIAIRIVIALIFFYLDNEQNKKAEECKKNEVSEDEKRNCKKPHRWFFYLKWLILGTAVIGGVNFLMLSRMASEDNIMGVKTLPETPETPAF